MRRPLKRAMGITLSIFAILVVAQVAWAAGKVKFINNSPKAVQVEMVTMYPTDKVSNATTTTFTLNSGQEKVERPLWPCVRTIKIDGVAKISPPPDDDPRCFSLSVIDLVVTVRADGKTEISQD